MRVEVSVDGAETSHLVKEHEKMKLPKCGTFLEIMAWEFRKVLLRKTKIGTGNVPKMKTMMMNM